MHALVLAVRPETAEALLGGRKYDHRRHRPTRLPARAYLAVSGTGTVIGQVTLDPAERETADGWAIPVRDPKRYGRPRPLSTFGLERTPRSFRYLDRRSG